MYAKVYSRTTESSLMEENITTRYVFLMLLVVADREGYVIGTDVALARRLNIPLAEFEAAIARLSAPDPASNSKDLEGRRVVPSDAERGYRLVNFQKYRDIRNEDDRREYMRAYMADYRANGRDRSRPTSGGHPHVNTGKLGKLGEAVLADSEAPAEAEGEKEAVFSPSQPPAVPNPDPNPNFIPTRAPVPEPMNGALQKIEHLHTVWQEITGQTRMRLDPAAERRWFDWLKGGWTEADLRAVIRHIQKGIEREARNPGALKLSNLLDPERFAEDLGMACRTRPVKPPPAPEPPKAPPPELSQEVKAKFLADLKAAVSKTRCVPQSDQPAPTKVPTTLPPEVVAELTSVQERNRGKVEL